MQLVYLLARKQVGLVLALGTMAIMFWLLFSFPVVVLVMALAALGIVRLLSR